MLLRPRSTLLARSIMSRVLGIRLLLALATVLAAFMPVQSVAQDDPNDVPLGDVARNLRKNNQPSKVDVIDDDNLTQVMDQQDARKNAGSSLRYLMAGETKGFQVSAPDVTCSLAFTPNVKSLLASSQYSQMDLPVENLGKLEGPAAIEGDALTVSIFNATDWHVSEVVVALTVVKKPGDALSVNSQGGGAGNDGTTIGNAFQDVRPERKPDMTLMYHMRAPAPPWSRAVFSAPLNVDLAPGQEWHWAIVQAKGYPPQGFVASTTTTAQSNQPPVQAPAPAAAPQAESATPLPQDHQ